MLFCANYSSKCLRGEAVVGKTAWIFIKITEEKAGNHGFCLCFFVNMHKNMEKN